jgi:hypothetical protein
MASRYKNIKKFRASNSKEYYTNPIYPTIPPTADDFYVLSSSGDRYDTLALDFYGDSKLWWVIASANIQNKASLAIEPGVQIRIPGDKSKAIELYDQINARL